MGFPILVRGHLYIESGAQRSAKGQSQLQILLVMTTSGQLIQARQAQQLHYVWSCYCYYISVDWDFHQSSCKRKSKGIPRPNLQSFITYLVLSCLFTIDRIYLKSIHHHDGLICRCCKHVANIYGACIYMAYRYTNKHNIFFLCFISIVSES